MNGLGVEAGTPHGGREGTRGAFELSSVSAAAGLAAEEGQGGVAVADCADLVERADLLGEGEDAAVLGDDDGVPGQERASAEKFENAVVFGGGGVGRVEEDVSELRRRFALARGKSFESAECVDGKNGGSPANIEAREIGFDERDGRAVRFDEGGGGGSAADGFDADGSGAGEEIEEVPAFKVGTEDVEERFTEIVAGGA